MESRLELLLLLLLALLVAGPILAIAAFVRVSEIRRAIDQIPKLIARIYDLEKKLAALEQRLKGQPAASDAKPAPGPSSVSPAKVEEAAPPRKAPSPGAISPPPHLTRVPTLASTHAAAPRVSAPLTFQSESVPPSSSDDVETIIAGHWFYYVGILALALAAAFFLKYAFDNNWIGPTGRVAIGLLAGSAMFPLSHWILQRGYRYFSEGIAALGATILYLSIWAGWHYYSLFTQSTAFAIMIVVTAVTTIVAIGRNSERVAVLALIGGVLTPTLVSTGKNLEVVLFTYLAILGAGLLAIAWKRNWATLPPLLFLSTVFYFWGWYAEFYGLNRMGTTLTFAVIFFVLFAVLPAIRSTRSGELSAVDICLVIANASEFLIALRAMLWPNYRWALTFALLALAALHLMAERALPAKQDRSTLITRMLYAGLALTFATLAIPIRLHAHWITLAWAAEGLALVCCGLRISSRVLRAAGLVMFAIVAARLIVQPIDTGLSPAFLLNARFLTMALCAGAAFAAFVFARRSKVKIEEPEAGVFVALAVAANGCLLVAISEEVWDLLGRTSSLAIDRRLAQELGLSMLWVAYALVQIVPGMKWKSALLRWQGLALMAIAIAKVFFFDLSFLTRFYRIVSFFALGLVLLGISFIYQQMSKAAEKT
jgi:uncharacterized membrane protein